MSLGSPQLLVVGKVQWAILGSRRRFLYMPGAPNRSHTPLMKAVTIFKPVDTRIACAGALVVPMDTSRPPSSPGFISYPDNGNACT
ncbi:hypothetical protein AVEN_236520-1 [Araneus ventricosus]|uniref:Uncharacterized protein n=1 Tax=Araneus ventricosus TaxID=182803 RepID=A0A4Y2TQB9_ARAVE|nr:hypothetical protein AVEN_236520-1 [Araneus ventricosus]